ncbi:tagaturonate reductase [Aquimarina sp. W85]|uniref:tagaturonate reductase n=1 Tax=Aquimarina rhodophyticola TaxID=3342246 RepID=UPI003670CC91
MSTPTVKKLNRTNLGLQNRLPIKIVQFGEGNFLRAFVDYAIQQLNKASDFNAGIAVVQPLNQGMIDVLNDQDGLYTLFLKGVKDGKEIQEKELITTIVSAINPYTNHQDYLDLAKEKELKFIISNTTEAGISFSKEDNLEMKPPRSFPAKLLQLLYARFTYFNGAKDKGLTIIPCELINYNSETLKEILLKYAAQWKLDQAFIDWLHTECSFHSTLVDRIVPGYPKDDIETYNKQLDYQDDLIVAAEVFLLWVIEGDDNLKKKLPFHTTDLDVKIVNDMQPYRMRKVRILNGAHTCMVPFSLLYGNETVKETIDNDFTGAFVNKAIFEEINETLPMDKSALQSFSNAVLDRFRNPFVRHKLSDIALNSISKFKVRVLPSLLAYETKKGVLPTNLTFALACLIRFYKGIWKGNRLPVNDSAAIVDDFKEIWKSNSTQVVASSILQREDFWDQDLTKIPFLEEAIVTALDEIETNGVVDGYVNFSKKF